MGNAPGVTDAYDMVNITQRKLQQLVRKNAPQLRKAIQRVIRIHRPQPHRPAVQDGLVGHGAQRRVAVHDLDALADEDVPQHGKQREDGGEDGAAVNDEEGDVVDLEPVGEVAHARAVAVGVGDDDDLVAAVNEFGGELVDMRLDAPGLRVEEVAHHGDVV